MTTSVGPYQFSETDVRKTVGHALDVLDQYPTEAHPHQAERRNRIASAIAGLDPSKSPIDQLLPALKVAWTEMLTARDDLSSAGLLPKSTTGSIVHLASSEGGLPKTSVDAVDIDHSGVVGDRQATRQHHGKPWQALCLWSAEVIEGLCGQGHPIAFGAAGENITVSGIDWSTLHPGVRLGFGTVLCEVSSYAVPCKQTAHLFADRDFNRIHHSQGPISRIYATVLTPGSATVGDAVHVEPT